MTTVLGCCPYDAAFVRLEQSARVTVVRLKPAKGRDKVFGLAGRRGFGGFQVALNACHRSWSVLQHRTASELHRSGRPSLEGWDFRRTPGCHSGRGYKATVQERESDVRRLVPEVQSEVW